MDTDTQLADRPIQQAGQLDLDRARQAMDAERLVHAGTPLAGPPMDAERVRAAVAGALPRGHNRHVCVDVTQHTVRLCGVVRSWEEWRAVVEAVRRQPNVRAIDDELRIDPGA